MVYFRFQWRALGLMFALAIWLGNARGEASISTEMPANCGSRVNFERELRRRLPTAASLDSVHVNLAPDGSGYRLLVEVGAQRRELHDKECETLLRAAVVVTVALFSTRELSSRSTADPLSPAPAESETPTRPRPPFALAVGAGVHSGTLPETTLLLEVDAEAGRSSYGIATGLRYLARVSHRDANDRGLEVSALGVYLAGTYAPWARLQARAGVVLYRLSGSGLGSPEPRHDTAWDAGPLIAASYTPLALPFFSLKIGAEAQLNALRARFEILDYGQVSRAPLISGSAFVHGGVDF